MIEQRWYQQEAEQSVFDYYESGKRGNVLIGLPTGTGKGVVIACLIKRILSQWPNQRIIMLTHVKELISQNAKKLLEVWPNAPLGLYSSGLKQKSHIQPVIFGGIGSVVGNVELFGYRDVLIIDEAHLLSPDENSMYQRCIAKLKAVNPYLIVIGLTATTYRMGQGELTDGGLFTDICYDLTNVAGFNRLIAEGFLCPLYPKKTSIEYDLTGVAIQNGDFAKGQLERAVDVKPVTLKILKEVCYYGNDRQCWLIFASGIEHSEHIAELLRSEFGIAATAIHSRLSSEERDKRISQFRTGEIRCAVNNNVLTVGFDHAPIDLIGHLRPTTSAALWVQMNGRGTRPCPDTGKTHCLALDFAGNTKRLGPINDPKKPRKKGEAKGDAPVRICDACGIYNHASASVCFACGAVFTFKEKLVSSASEQLLIREDAPIIESFNVQRVFYTRHIAVRAGAKPCIKITYVSGIKQFIDWLYLDADGIAAEKSKNKWKQLCDFEPPTPKDKGHFESATDAALSICSTFKPAKSIRVWVNRAMPEIQSVSYV